MNLRELRLFFLASYLVVIGIIIYPLVLPSLNVEKTGFISLAVLGENGTTEAYFPGDSSSIAPRQQVNWTLRVVNNLGKSTYVTIKVKLSDSDIPGPNSILCSPSNAPELYNFKKIILDTEGINLPLNWGIIKTRISPHDITIESVLINGEEITSNITLTGQDVKIIFEIWIYKQDTAEFQFSHNNGLETICVWNQIYFNLIPEQGS